MNRPSPSSPTPPQAVDTLFDGLEKALSGAPRWPYLYLPQSCQDVAGHYDAALLGQLAARVDSILEYGIVHGEEQSLPVDKALAFDRLKLGRTMICNGLHHGDPLSAQWAARLHGLLGVPGKPAARFFYASSLQQAYGMHLDPFYTLTLQISGSKQWKIGRARESLDMATLDHSILAPESEDEASQCPVSIKGREFDTVVLKAGDALLLHPGVWHHVAPLGDSFSVALDVVPVHQPDGGLDIALIRHGQG